MISSETIESNKTIDLFYDIENEHRNIILDKKKRIIKDFKKLDITIVEILDIDNIKEYFF